MLKKIIMFLTMLLGSSLAMAENLFDPVSGDQSLKMLDAMFGKLEIFGNVGADAFASSMAIFNGGVLILGGVLVIYSLVIGTIGTAHDGEMMGKKYSSVWIPLRTVVGTALVLPVIGGGSYCLMQLIVGWLIVQGVGLADKVWESYMGTVGDQATVGVRAKEANDVIWATLESAVCMRGIEKIVEENKNMGALPNGAVFGRTENTDTISQIKTWKYGLSEGATGMFTKDMCGQTTFSLAQDTTWGSKTTAMLNAQKEQALSVADRAAIGASLQSANAAASSLTGNMINSVDQLAQAYVANPEIKLADMETSVNTILKTYNDGLRAETKKLLGDSFNLENMKENAKKDGWFLAGAWFLKMSNLMDVAGTVMNMYPSSTGALIIKTKSSNDQQSAYYNAFQSRYGGLLDKIRANSGSLGISEGRKNVEEDGYGSILMDGVKNWDFSEMAVRTFRKSVSIFIIQDNEHPIMVMKGLGEWLFNLGTALLVLVKVTGSENLKMITMIVLPICYGLGFTLSFVMPMMPFMIWLGCLMAWIILCVEALVAAPMWAIMHLTMNGDDMVGTGAQGYRLVLSLMLRPVLMIFGFIAAISIIQVFGQFVNTVFTDVYLLSQQNWGFSTMIFGMLAFPALYLGCMWVLIIKCMGIVHQIPDQLLQWFGGGGTQLGNMAEQVGNMDSAGFRATRAVSDQLGRAGEVYQRSRDMAQQQRQTAALEKQNAQENRDKNFNQMNEMAGSGAGDVLNKMNADSANSGDLKNQSKDDAGNFTKKDDQEAFSKIQNDNKKRFMGVASAISANPEKSSAMKGFNKDVLNGLNDNLSFKQSVDKAFPKAFDDEHGQGAYDFALKSSGLNEGTKASDALDSKEFRQNAESLGLMTEKLQDAGIKNHGFMEKEIASLNKSNLSNSEKIVDLSGRVNNEVKASRSDSGFSQSSRGQFGGDSMGGAARPNTSGNSNKE